MPSAPALVGWTIVVSPKSTPEISKGELPKSKSSGALKRRVAEIKIVRRSTSNLAHADLADTPFAEGQRLLDRANHYNPGRPIRQGDGSGCESPEHIDDRHRAGRPVWHLRGGYRSRFPSRRTSSGGKATRPLSSNIAEQRYHYESRAVNRDAGFNICHVAEGADLAVVVWIKYLFARLRALCY